jgi:hypothetical protein
LNLQTRSAFTRDIEASTIIRVCVGMRVERYDILMDAMN